MEPVVILGHTITYRFPNVIVCADVEATGWGEDVLENYAKAAKGGKAAVEKFAATWPDFVKAAIENPPDDILDIKTLSMGEAFTIAGGFNGRRLSVRKTSTTGAAPSVAS
jgi:predicted Zn-dependent protease with MMP-like domain